MTRLKAVLAVLGTGLVVGLSGYATPASATTTLPNVVVPVPVSETGNGATFTLKSSATVSSDVANVGTYLAGVLRKSTGYAVPVVSGSGTIA